MVEPDNPVVVANQGVVRSDAGRPLDAVPLFERALALDPDFLEARFQLAVALARGGRRQPALEAARALYDRLPANAPQRPEVLRLISALQ
jgi:cytochrome c-type biogenesis protein CcmH/NrfG